MITNSNQKYFSVIKLIFTIILTYALSIQLIHFGIKGYIFETSSLIYFYLLLVLGIILSISTYRKFLLSPFVKSHLELVIAGSIFLIAFIIRIKASSLKQPWGDEHYQYYSTWISNALYQASRQHQTPIDFMFHYASNKTFGNTLFSMRFSAIFFSSLALGNLYFIFRRIFKDYASCFILMLFFFFNYNFNYSSIEARPPALAFFLITILLNDLFNYFDDQSRSNQFALFSTTLFYILSTGIQPFSLIGAMGVIALVVTIKSNFKNKAALKLFGIFTAIIILYLPLFYYLYKVAPSRLPTDFNGIGSKYFGNFFKGLTLEYIQEVPIVWINLICPFILLLRNRIKKVPNNPLLYYLFASWLFFQIIYVSIFLTFVQWPLVYWYMLSSTAVSWVIFSFNMKELFHSTKWRALILLIVFLFYNNKASINNVVERNFYQRNDTLGFLKAVEKDNKGKKIMIPYCLSFNGCSEMFSKFEYLPGSSYKEIILRNSYPFNNYNEVYADYSQLIKKYPAYLVISDCDPKCFKDSENNLKSPNLFFKSSQIISFKFEATDKNRILKMINLLESYTSKVDKNNLGSTFFVFESQILLYIMAHNEKMAEEKFATYKLIFKNNSEYDFLRLRKTMDYFYMKF